MKTMGTIQRVAVCLVLTIIPLTGCGDETAPLGATVSGPGKLTVTYSSAGNFNDITSAPLEFKVLDAKGKPLPGVTIRFFAGGSVVALTDRSGVPLNASDQWLFETTTDDRGLSPVDIYALWYVPPCDIAAALTVNGTVEASIGVSTAVWTVEIKVDMC